MPRRNRQLDLLLAYMSEHDEHARAHEQLRSAISATTTAAAFVVIGVALQEKAALIPWVAAGVLVVAIAAVGLWISVIHRNRFRAHRDAAGYIREGLEGELWADGGLATRPSGARRKFVETKSAASLDGAWNAVHLVTIVIGLIMALVGVAQR